MSEKRSEAHQVVEFTEGSQHVNCPVAPNPLSKEEVCFVTRMVLSELVELVQTVCETDEEAVAFLKERVETDISNYDRCFDDPDQLAADQADAAVDAIYYLYNCFGKKGINLSAVFDVVHAANMAKRDPESGKFIRRESDGKVLKPPGWQAPNILTEIQRQKTEGSWPNA